MAALEALALNPVVIPSDCASHAAVSAEALRLAQAANDDWLFCEDDIVPHPRFHEALGLAARGKQVTYLYLHETLGMNLWYPAELQAAIAAREPITPSRVRLRDASGLCNAQCVYIPARAVRQMMPTALLEWNRSFDIYLEQFLRDTRRHAYAVVPNAAQHTEDRTGRPTGRTGRKRSLSFDLWR